MTQGEEQADAGRPFLFLHQLAGYIVDRGDVIGVDRVPQPERVRDEDASQRFDSKPAAGIRTQCSNWLYVVLSGASRCGVIIVDISRAPSNRGRMDAHADVRLARVEKLLTLPTLLTVCVLLLLLLMPLIVNLDRAQDALLWRAQVVTGLLFVFEYLLRLGTAREKARFVRSNLIDTAVAVSSVLLPLLPDLRFLLALRVISAVSLILEVGKDFQHLFRIRNIPYALIGATLVVLVTGALEFHYENPAKGSNINSAQDGLWWAVVTMSTVGYGDKYPITSEGRAIAIVLMMLGPVFLGILYAGLTTMFMRPTEEELAEQHRADDERLARIVEQTVIDGLGPISEKLDRALGLLETHKLRGPDNEAR